VIARDHHENWDGSGYPVGKAGDDIHVYGRIVALADVYDALRHDRCYKKAWSRSETLEFIEQENGKKFDPKLVTVLNNSIEEVETILQNYPDSES
jgi:HD-GYP domain-containing protein (c-di-GMP phosphodiesterase class II)